MMRALLQINSESMIAAGYFVKTSTTLSLNSGVPLNMDFSSEATKSIFRPTSITFAQVFSAPKNDIAETFELSAFLKTRSRCSVPFPNRRI